MGLYIQFPMRLVSLANQREHWGARKARAAKQRERAAIHLGNKMVVGELPYGPPWLVRITRLGPRALDGNDNVNISAKHVRDGLADVLGVDDGSDLVLWTYAQEKSKKYEVRVEIFGGANALSKMDSVHEREKLDFINLIRQGNANGKVQKEVQEETDNSKGS